MIGGPNKISQSIDNHLFALNHPKDFKEESTSLETATQNSKKVVNPFFQSSLQPFSPNPSLVEKSHEISHTVKVKANIFGGIYNWVKKLFGFQKPSKEEEVDKKEKVSSPEIIPTTSSKSKIPPLSPSRKWVEAMRENNVAYRSILDDEFDFNGRKLTDALMTRIHFELVKRQQKLRENDISLINGQIQEEQEFLKEIHKKRKEQKDELALLLKKSTFEAVASPIISAGIAVGYVITGSMAIVGAATIASGGSLTPLLVASGIFNGIFMGLQTINTYSKNSKEIKLKNNEGVSLKLNEEKNMIEFELKVSLDAMKQAMKNWNDLTTAMRHVVQNQAEQKINFR